MVKTFVPLCNLMCFGVLSLPRWHAFSDYALVYALPMKKSQQSLNFFPL
jgi:hypothetical protein